MKTFKLQFHKDSALLIDTALAARNQATQTPVGMKIEWHPWEESGTILECKLTALELEIVSYSLYRWGPDSIRTRGIMDKIIFKLLLPHIG